MTSSIKLYEVRFDLESGSALNVLMAATTADEAKGFAVSTLRQASEPRSDGDCLRYCWRSDDITVREVRILDEALAA